MVGRDEEIDLLIAPWGGVKGRRSGGAGLGEPVSASRASPRHWRGRGSRIPPALFLLADDQDSVLFPFVDQLGRAAGSRRD